MKVATILQRHRLLKIAGFALLFLIIFMARGSTTHAANLGSATFPDPVASRKWPLYMTVGGGDFDGGIAASIIISDTAGNVSIDIEDGQFCSNNGAYAYRTLDLPQSSAAPGFSTNYWIVSINASLGFTGTTAGPIDTGFSIQCSGTKNAILNFTMTESNRVPQFNNKYVVVFFAGIHAYNNISYPGCSAWSLGNCPGAMENSFRIHLSGAGNPKAYPMPSGVAGINTVTFFNFSNRNHPSNEYADYVIDYDMPCGIGPQPMRMQFYDVDYGRYQSVPWVYPDLTLHTFRNNPGNYAVEGAPGTTPGSFYAGPTLVNGYTVITGGQHALSPNYTTQMAGGNSYRVEVRGLTYINAISYSVSVPTSLFTANPNCAVTSCRIKSIYSITNGTSTIYSGDQIGFVVDTTNVPAGYVLGSNGPGYAPSHSNYMVDGPSGFQPYMRTPVPANGTDFVATLVAFNDTGNFVSGMYARYPNGTNLPPGDYPFNWGIVQAGVGWLGETCTFTLRVSQREEIIIDLCTNLDFAQTTIPPPFSDPNNDQYCDQPDNQPTITFTEVCDNTNNRYVIIISIADADPGNPVVNYSGGSSPPGSQVGRVIEVPRNPELSTTIQASTNGVRPIFPRELKSDSRTSVAYGPCIYRFTMVPQSGIPVLNDEELPTLVSSTSYGGTATTSSPSGVRNISTTKNLYYQRSGSASTTSIRSTTANINYPLASNDIWTNTALPLGIAFTAGDRICSTLTVTIGSGWVDRGGGVINNASYPRGATLANTPQCTTVSDKPYIKAFGADVAVGSGFGVDCSSQPSAGVTTFNRRITGAGGGYIGGGAQFGVMSNSTITNFASMAMRDATGPSAVINARTFSNQVTGAAGGNFGQRFCAHDYWANAEQLISGGAVDVGSSTLIDNGRYSYPAGNLVNNSGIKKKIAIYVNGDLTITKNVQYETTTWSTVANIPSFYVIVRGNIYIRPDVTVLDGFYIAQPDAVGNRGRIFTCTDVSGPPTQAALTGNCRNNKLKVNGALLAQQVNFTRTKGSLRNATLTSQTASGATTQPASPTTPATPVTTTVAEVEAESMTSIYGGVVTDGAASGNRAVFQWGSGVGSSSSRTFTLPSAANRIVLRARGDQCSGPPVARIRIDGAIVYDASVSLTTYTEYPFSRAIAAGSHTVAVEFLNDLWNPPTCDRNLYVDKISFTNTTTPAPPPPPAPATTTLSFEDSNSANLAESVEFSPDFWVVQPAIKPSDVPGTYDSVVSLPPSL